jgi:hypothetical protein
MKKLLSLLLFSLLFPCPGPAQFGVNITGFDRDGRLTWDNCLCTTRPVYELLEANSPAGPWTHALYLTNQTALILTNLPTVSPASAFYQIVWAQDTPLVFDYAFFEAEFFPFFPAAVEGQLTITLPNLASAGTWNLDRTGAEIDDLHPVGSGSLTWALLSCDAFVLWLDRAPDAGTRLDGVLTRTPTSGGCAFTAYQGEVYQGTFSGEEIMIGYFIATSPP